MRLKEKKLLQKFAATLKKFSAQGAKKVKYGILKATIINGIPKACHRKKVFVCGGEGVE